MGFVWSVIVACGFAAHEPTAIEVKKISVDGAVDEEKARLVIEADLKGLTRVQRKALYATAIQNRVRVSPSIVSQDIRFSVEVIEGDPKEIVFALGGNGEVRNVTGENIESWSIRWSTGGVRRLQLHLGKTEPRQTTFTGQILVETTFSQIPSEVTVLSVVAEPVALSQGYIRIDAEPGLDVDVSQPAGLVAIDPKYLPEVLRAEARPGEIRTLAFRFHGSDYSMPIRIATADPEAARVTLTNFRISGELSGDQATFVLTALARVKNQRGGKLQILSGDAALTAYEHGKDWRLQFDQGRYVAVFDSAGEFPIELKFNATVRTTNGWNRVTFHTAPGSLQPIVLRGLPPETEFEFVGAARPERSGDEFVSYLPPHGKVDLSWKTARREQEGALFYAAEIFSQVSVGPGLMRQTAVLDFKVMQGELSRVVLLLGGNCEVTRVQGSAVLGWSVGSRTAERDQSLEVRLNQPQKDKFVLQVEVQTPLGSFPQTMDVVSVRPEGATRFSGWVRVVNEGAVRIEVLDAVGVSQIPPEQFPQTDTTKALTAFRATQMFAYRYSGVDLRLKLQADNILPEVAVSEVLTYHVGETELAIDAELELDIRDAPLRELMVRAPAGYAVARLNASGLSDYFVTDAGTETGLRLVYANPVLGRQLVEVRFERNQPLGEGSWRLPRVEVLRAKSVRGHIGVVAEAGFRLTASAIDGVTEIATAFFPKKVAGIQAAYRVNDASWVLTMNIERLPQSIQADVFHLFSVGEGIAYGSSIINYLISGSPTAAFRVELSSEYFNVEFSGKDIRGWQKTDTGYVVQLHTPVSGAYILLVTYERPFRAQGETLTFTGARPLDVVSEQGHTVVVSSYQFNVRPVSVSTSLTPLEPGEVPAEHRLFFDAPVLAAYRYTSRPFNLQLALQPLAQGDTVSQVVDRASIVTRITREGQVVTDARYFVKNKGVPHLRLLLPEGAQLWSTVVNSNVVVPIVDGRTNLIPLPQRTDPNMLNELRVKIATRAKSTSKMKVTAPILAAPVLLAEWRIEPDEGKKLVYRGGTLSPAGGIVDQSGFAGLRRLLSGQESWRIGGTIAVALLLGALGVTAFKLGAIMTTQRSTFRYLFGGFVGFAAGAASVGLLVWLAYEANAASGEPARGLYFVAPIQQSGAALTVDLANLNAKPSATSLIWVLWPGLIGLVLWVWARLTSQPWLARNGIVGAWFLIFWATLRLPDGGTGFFVVACLFVAMQLLVPAVKLWLRARRNERHASGVGLGSTVGSETIVLMLSALALGTTGFSADATKPTDREAPARADSVIQHIHVDDRFASGSVTIKWQANKGEILPVIHAPGVITKIEFPASAARLVQLSTEPRVAHGLFAEQSGGIEARLEYQVQVVSQGDERGFAVPVEPGLVNQATVTVLGQDVDIQSPQAVSILRKDTSMPSNTVAVVVLKPVGDSWIGWKPRARDTRREAVVFYAELGHLYVPTAGVIEGRHQVNIRPAQGEVSELIFNVPDGVTVSDVESAVVSIWRFDPQEHQLRVTVNPPQSRAMTLLIKSQIASSALPFEQTARLISVNRAAGQVGLLGIATGAEVQLDDVTAFGLAPINLEDFPVALLETLQNQVQGLALRRAFRYSEPSGKVTIKASAVAPDIRVESQQTLSLAEDRIVLAATLETQIARAGIFKLSFELPNGLDVESISGQAMSHWTEIKAGTGRLITLHLKTRTEGKHSFVMSLVGAGVRSTTNLVVPRVVLNEAEKQRGQLVIIPEQGLRLQATTREGVTQIDPAIIGVRQKGVLAFRLLERDWRLALDIERVDAWIQVTGLQNLTISDAQVRVDANLQYEIENTGLKSLIVSIPANADSVRFRGDQVSDFVPRDQGANALWRDWEIKLHRRVLGKYVLQVSYRVPVPESAPEIILLGIEAREVNVQRGFVTLQTAGRLQLRVESVPSGLQPAEWQSIPRALRQGIAASAASYTYRVVEPAFSLPVKLMRHEAARLLPARVHGLTLTSSLSDDGVMLTQVTLQLVPGDKRLLRVTLPEDARFWFAFVNQNSVWPWRETNQVLIPLQEHSKITETSTVEFFYTSRVGHGKPGSLNLKLAGPKLDLPLENITWRVFLSEKWKVVDWSGTLQLQSDRLSPTPVALDIESYVQNEFAMQIQKTREAEKYLNVANQLLEQGDPERARQSLQAAFGLSQHDAAFNEDARVQLHNLKMQQALVGLNVGQAKLAGDPGAISAIPRALREGRIVYTQQEAKQLIERNAADESAVQLKLVERIIQQQEAALPSPTAIRATVPEQGRLLTFVKPLEVDPWAELSLRLLVTSPPRVPITWRVGSLALVLVLLAACRRFTRKILATS